MIRNLIFHIFPVKGTGVWQWNVAQLLRRMDQFNGQRVVSVVTDGNTDTFDTVVKSFRGTVTNFIHQENDPTLGEVTSFFELMRRVENIDPGQVTFYGHAKGVKYTVPGWVSRGSFQKPLMVREWTRVMYSNMLDYPSLIEDALRSHTMVGTFKSVGGQFLNCPKSWHYAGTFFWFRNNQIFSNPQWYHVPLQWYGVEAWPGIIISMDNHEEQAASLFLTNHPGEFQPGFLYSPDIWKDNLGPMWKDWQIRAASLLRLCSIKELATAMRSQRIVVTGPLRGGTGIAARIIGHELKLPVAPEITFDFNNHAKFFNFLRSHDKFVIHAPAMAEQMHHLTDCDVVWVHRNLEHVIRSQRWVGHDDTFERDKYFDHSKDDIVAVKTRAWQRFQRMALGERAWDLDYESLRGHQLWIEPTPERGFGQEGTKPMPYPYPYYPYPFPYPPKPPHKPKPPKKPK